MSEVAYPPRPSVFPLKLQKLLLREKVAEVIDPQGCWLLMAVASVEDDRGCRGPVSFWNDQLMSMLGIGTEPRLDRTRKKCIGHGWLYYRRGSNRRQGAYFVTIPEPYSLTIRSKEEARSANEIGGRTRAGQPTKPTVTMAVELAAQRTVTNEIEGHSIGPPSFFPSSGEDTLTPFGNGTHAEDVQTDVVDVMGSQVRPEPLAVLIAAWVLAKLPGWNTPGGIRESPNRRGQLQQRQRCPHWRKHWRVAVERLGKSRRAKGETASFQGIGLDTFLKDEGFLDRVLEGAWDDHGCGATNVPNRPSGKCAMMEIERVDGMRSTSTRGGNDVG